MPSVLVLYGTTDGHTGKVAAAIADAVRDSGCGADVVEAASPAGRVGPEPYDAVVVAASVHGGKFQGPVRRWIQMHAASLNQIPTAFVAVCLTVLDKRAESQHAIATIMQRFFADTGWQPPVHTAIAGALLYTRYNWLKRWIMKRIVAKAGGDTDTGRDYEYTDWPALRVFTRQFVTRALREEIFMTPS